MDALMLVKEEIQAVILVSDSNFVITQRAWIVKHANLPSQRYID